MKKILEILPCEQTELINKNNESLFMCDFMARSTNALHSLVYIIKDVPWIFRTRKKLIR